MKRFQLIEAMGLAVNKENGVLVVSAWELENVLSEAPEIHGSKDDMNVPWSVNKDKLDTHTARLVCIEEIKREPLKVEFESKITTLGCEFYDGDKLKGMLGKKVRVVVEEIQE